MLAADSSVAVPEGAVEAEWEDEDFASAEDLVEEEVSRVEEVVMGELPILFPKLLR